VFVAVTSDEDGCHASVDISTGEGVVAVSDLEAIEETLDLLSTPGALEQIRQAEADIAAGEAVDADELRRQLAAPAQRESRG
jgi:antitoxin YefM